MNAGNKTWDICQHSLLVRMVFKNGVWYATSLQTQQQLLLTVKQVEVRCTPLTHLSPQPFKRRPC